MKKPTQEFLRRNLTLLGFLYFLFMAYMLLSPLPPTSYILDYTFSIIHFLAFTLLGLFVGFSRRRWNVWGWAVLLVIWGVGSEFLQRYTGRFCEVGDMIQNAVGSNFGLWIATRRILGRLPFFKPPAGKANGARRHDALRPTNHQRLAISDRAD